MKRNDELSYCCELTVQYALSKRLIEPEDVYYVRNQLLGELLLDEAWEGKCTEIPQTPLEISERLFSALKEDAERYPILLKEDTQTQRDLLDTAFFGHITPWPSAVTGKFYSLAAEKGIQAATDYFYKLAIDTNYIRADRIARNKQWSYACDWGKLQITINLTKPEKNPKEIAAEKLLPQSGYPKCMLCPENVGYRGRLNFPARQNHRAIPLKLNGEDWFLQYSPYVYYNEHCIVLKGAHVPMKIERDTLVRLLDFCTQFPHYFIGSNADLPIVGGSILSHDHFQGGNYTMPMFEAQPICRLSNASYPQMDMVLLDWPMSTVKFCGRNASQLVDAAYSLHCGWMQYSDPDHDILAYTDQVRHNTITPIVRMEQGQYAVYCVLRNNRTSPEYPDGIFHPHAQWHHIKKENIGLIEVMGHFILPGRLESELSLLKNALIAHDVDKLPADSPAFKHAEWGREILARRNVTQENIDTILQQEVGSICCHVLQDAGVFKTTASGRAGFVKFLNTLGWSQN